MIAIAKTTEGRSDEVPFEAIKSFGKVKFKDEGIVLPRFKLKLVKNFLCSDDVRGDMPPMNKSRFRRINIFRETSFKSIRKGFSDNFVNDIAQAYRSEVLGILRIVIFWDKDQKELC